MKGTRNRKIEMCLCSSCAKRFYQSVDRRIYRGDPFQGVMDMCDCCRTRRGYDFVVAEGNGR